MKPITIYLFLLFTTILWAQEPLGNNYYWIEFKDKGEQIENKHIPQNIISQKSIDRRQKYGIPITQNDYPVNKTYLEELEKRGAKIFGTSKWLNGALVTIDTLDRIKKLPFVKPPSKNRPDRQKDKKNENCSEKKYHQDEKEQRDTLYGESWNQIARMKGEGLHYEGYTGKGITIAVIDEGFYGVDKHPAFDSLRTSGRLLGYKDFTMQQGSLFSKIRGDHGSKVLSCMAAKQPGTMIGTAPDAQYWLLSSEHSPGESILEEYFWIFAAEFADSIGADIITTSLGYALFDENQWNHTYKEFYKNTAKISKAAKIAWEKGITVIASAGNEGTTQWRYLLFPGESPEIITVGAIDENGVVSDFSSRGYPTRKIIKPEIVAPGETVYVVNGENGYTHQRGTSFATPLVSGLIACCLQMNPTLKNNQLKQIITENTQFAKKINHCYGYGLPDFQKIMEEIKKNLPIKKITTIRTTPIDPIPR